MNVHFRQIQLILFTCLVLISSSSHALVCSLDVDDNGQEDALTDGLLVIRNLFGLSGTALTKNALGSNARRNTPNQISNYLNTVECQQFFDVDGNQSTDALTDGLIIIRKLFGISGLALTKNAIASNATRTSETEISQWLNINQQTIKITPSHAARFLTQATFGPTDQSINNLINTGSYRTWLQRQISTPASYQLTATQDYWLKNCPLNRDGKLINHPSEVIDTWEAHHGRHNTWWQSVLHGKDQLRQRVAFALSQIFVVSDKPQILVDSQFGMASYYDTLLKHSFGNYRDLLEDVTLNPVMGLYLGMLRNQKANPELNIRPDENYAREVLQLFSMGVHELNIDGTLALENGQPIPTYNQETIQEFARVFTGWNYADVKWRAWIGNGSRVLPMVPVEEFHDRKEKQLLNGALLAANQSARADLDAALDNIFNHPNVGPFISKQLIQRLVTSNPTSAYVGRIARIFNNNGSGIRGDLTAVISAILLDDEARNGHNKIASFGKLKEPLLRLSHFFRAFDLQPNIKEGSFWRHRSCGRGEYTAYVMGNSWNRLSGLSSEIGQAVLRAPSVFNFYRPDYTPPDSTGKNALVAPEFQLATENFVINTANLINYSIYWAKPSTEVNDAGYSWLDFSQVIPLANNADNLLNYLNRVLLSGAMSDQLRAILKRHLADPFFQYHENIELDKARDAIALIMISPEYLIQQ